LNFRGGIRVENTSGLAVVRDETPARRSIKEEGMNTFRTRAFTLVELLVVMAIIGILAGLLLTAVSRAKNSAAKTVDINNLKQQITTLHLFTTDNGDYLPWPNWLAGDQPDRQGWLYTIDLAASGPDRFKAETGAFWDTLRNLKLYACPMDKPDQHTERQQRISTYVMNGAVIGYERALYPPTRSALMKSEDVALWETDERDPNYFNDGASYPAEGVSRRHNQGAIRATFDAAVGYVRFDDWYEQVAETNRNHLWCYPNSPDGR
jgi:prepilin-type N-terminal cleavage/methylation domain-containing protein